MTMGLVFQVNFYEELVILDFYFQSHTNSPITQSLRHAHLLSFPCSFSGCGRNDPEKAGGAEWPSGAPGWVMASDVLLG